MHVSPCPASPPCFFARRQRRIDANLKAAGQHYDVGKLRRGVLRAWRQLAAAQLRIRVGGSAKGLLLPCQPAKCMGIDVRGQLWHLLGIPSC